MKILALSLIRAYQIFLSPLLGSANCRFLPTCSNYSAAAITKYGVIMGIFISMLRLLRCNPFCKGGVDEVK
ncbi:MAG: membrane protein insertion efficiency factor YidD [Alphaproteobacteria bacterium]|nr:membrane protein insertion efficiency factor YidD [Alphaproteobacteria bacterium]